VRETAKQTKNPYHWLQHLASNQQASIHNSQCAPSGRPTPIYSYGLSALFGPEQQLKQLEPILIFEPLLTSEQTATLLQIHAKTLQRMARDGEIPGIRVGKLSSDN
jgi:excisionase family DNA binding protein